MICLTPLQEKVYKLIKSNPGLNIEELKKIDEAVGKYAVIKLYEFGMIDSVRDGKWKRHYPLERQYRIGLRGKPLKEDADEPIECPYLIGLKEKSLTTEQIKIVKVNSKLPENKQMTRSQLARKFGMTKTEYNMALINMGG